MKLIIGIVAFLCGGTLGMVVQSWLVAARDE